MQQIKKGEKGCNKPHRSGWARVPLSSFFPQISVQFSYFSSNFFYFLPHFGPPLAHLERSWLRHWRCSWWSLLWFFFIWYIELISYSNKKRSFIALTHAQFHSWGHAHLINISISKRYPKNDAATWVEKCSLKSVSCSRNMILLVI